MTKRLQFFSVCVLAVALQAGADDRLSLERIIELHTEAVGGKAAIENVNSVQMKLKIEEPTFQVEGVYKADRKLRMRIDIFAGDKRVYTESYDGTKAWQQGSDKSPAKASSPEGTAALLRGILMPDKIFGLHELAARGHRIELAGREEVDGVNYYVLKLTFSDGSLIHLYIHPQNWLIERTRKIKALHPDMDPTQKWTETRASDFRKVDGVVRSFKQVEIDLKTGNVLQTTTILEVKTNVSLSNDLFLAPK